MVAIAAFFGIYTLIYGVFIAALIIGFDKIPDFKPVEIEPKTTFSIIIPFRTEEHNLPRLLESLTRLDYPRELFELIFVDDASEDFSVNHINKWRMNNGLFQTTLLQNIRLSGSPKKDAISRAIPIVKTNWIITTDADCIVPEKWLLAIDGYIRSHPVEMIAAAVVYDGKNTFSDHFQRLDFMSLQGATIGSFGIKRPFMCNGANFAYAKKFFNELGGFSGNDAIASGDDVFLLQKAVAKFPQKVAYLKSREAIVRTKPCENAAALFNQRVRWAAKSVSYESRWGEDLALVVFLANIFLVISVILTATGFFNWTIPVVLWLLKLMPDWLLLYKTNRFLNNRKPLFPLFASIVYPFFSVIVALYALFGTYRWKGRKFKA